MRKKYLITELLKERPKYADISVQKNETEQKKLLRALFNVPLPLPISDDFLRVQDEYLQEEITEKGITSTDDLETVKPDIYLWQGDITTMYAKKASAQNRAKALKIMRFWRLVASQWGLFHLPENTFLKKSVAKVLQKRLLKKCQVPKPA